MASCRGRCARAVWGAAMDSACLVGQPLSWRRGDPAGSCQGPCRSHLHFCPHLVDPPSNPFESVAVHPGPSLSPHPSPSPAALPGSHTQSSPCLPARVLPPLPALGLQHWACNPELGRGASPPRGTFWAALARLTGGTAVVCLSCLVLSWWVVSGGFGLDSPGHRHDDARA